MMKFYRKYRKKRQSKSLFGLLFCLVLILSSGSQGQVHATDPGPAPYAGDSKLSVARCVARGNFEFGLFLRSIVYSDGFSEAFIEPFNDVLVRNQCHAGDVFYLTRQLDRLRKAIRDAYTTCATHRLPSLKEGYNRTLAELYYVRHVVDAGIVRRLPFEILGGRIGQDAAITNREDLYRDMSNRYIRSYFFTKDEFDALFLRFESKYKNKVETYIRCESEDWNAVKDKFFEFIDFFAEGDVLHMQGWQDVGARAADVGEEFVPTRTIDMVKEVLDGNKMAALDYTQSIVQVNLNNFRLEKGAGRMGDFLADSLPTFDRPTTHSEIFGILEGAERRYNLDKMENDLKVEFSNLYFTMSDQSSEILLNTLDGRGVPQTGLIEILDESLPVLYGLKEKASNIHKKQCTQ